MDGAKFIRGKLTQPEESGNRRRLAQRRVRSIRPIQRSFIPCYQTGERGSASQIIPVRLRHPHNLPKF